MENGIIRCSFWCIFWNQYFQNNAFFHEFFAPSPHKYGFQFFVPKCVDLIILFSQTFKNKISLFECQGDCEAAEKQTQWSFIHWVTPQMTAMVTTGRGQNESLKLFLRFPHEWQELPQLRSVTVSWVGSEGRLLSHALIGSWGVPSVTACLPHQLSAVPFVLGKDPSEHRGEETHLLWEGFSVSCSLPLCWPQRKHF